MMKRGAKRPAFSDFSSDPSTSTLQSKRVMEAPSLGLHKAESSNQNLTAEPTSLDPKRAESSCQHVRALNTQFASWVQSQLQNHPDELWEDGVRDYLSHGSDIMEKFKDVVNWLKANSEKSKPIAKSSLFSDKKSPFTVLENNATVQSESDSVSTKPALPMSSPFLTTGPQSSAALFSGFQKSTSASPSNDQNESPAEKSKPSSQHDFSNSFLKQPAPTPFSFSSSSSEKDSEVTQQADASNGFPKPPAPFTFSFSAAANSGPNFSTQTQSPFSTGFSFSAAHSSGIQSSTPLFGSTYLFSGIQSGSTTTSNVEASAEDDEEEPKPSSPSVKKSEEIGVVVVHEAKCKVYIKPDNPAEKGWKDMGVGHLLIKTKEGANKATKESKPTIVVRNDVGKILLNALIYSGIKTNLQKNTVATVFHTSDEADIVVTKTYLLKLKNAEEAAKLADTIKESAPSD